MLPYLADALDASEAADLRAHLASGCPICAGALAEAQATFAHVGRALAPVAPPADAWHRLEKRVKDSQPPPLTLERPRRMRLVMTGAIAAAFGALLSAAVLYLPAREKAKLVDSRDVRLVSLSSQDVQPQARGRIFWDKQKNTWHVYVFDLKPPPPGKEYELWFITTDSKKVPAGMLTVDKAGKGSTVVAVPQNLGPLALAAITDEPAGGVQQPTGSIQLAGEVK
ncbi:MAG TPA: anti-sigma factor [Tepidisphaeraceae bacterium]|jgi:anti-sigma-K factor RskA